MKFESNVFLLMISRIALVRSFATHQRAAFASKHLILSTRHYASIDTSDDVPNICDVEPINLITIEKQELQQYIESWGFPKYRTDQVWKWIRDGVTSIDDMTNLPQKLKEQLRKHANSGSLELHTELISKDGTRKRAYRLHDGQLIESVLMPYDDGRFTACISSQAGCAMGCVFCATGQMGFARQLTSHEIFEQVARFDSELKREDIGRLSNVVFMGMGEPLANYRNVRTAVNRITNDLGIGARRITISTVGVVPNIRKLFLDPDMPQIRLAVSLHCASDKERTKLLPANARYGGLDQLMLTLKEYIETTNRRITLEWALIENQNDDPATAAQLGSLVKRFGIRRDMVHVNVIPLNPTGGYGGSPSGRARVNAFCATLVDNYGIACTPRVRRGIDINAGCGQLKATLERKSKTGQAFDNTEESIEQDQLELVDFLKESSFQVGVYEDHVHENDDDDEDFLEVDVQVTETNSNVQPAQKAPTLSSESAIATNFFIETNAVDFEEDDYEDPEFTTDWELEEAQRLVALVQNSCPPPINSKTLMPHGKTTTTTSITDDDAVQEAKKRRKKLLKNLKAIDRLMERKRQDESFQFNDEQSAKVAREMEWRAELESVEHNLK